MHTADQGVQRTAKAGRRRWVGLAVSLILLVAIFGFLFPMLTDYADVWNDIGDLDTGWIVVLALAGIWNLFALIPLVMVSQPGTRFGEAFVDMTAGTAAANTVPGGSAIGIGINWAMFDSWGFTPTE